MGTNAWMNKGEIAEILDAFLQLEANGIDQPFSADLVKEKSKLVFGFELEIDAKAPKRTEAQTMKAVITHNLSLREFKKASTHLLGIMDYFLYKIAKKEFGSMMSGVDLKYRMPYPVCFDRDELRREARRYPARYPN